MEAAKRDWANSWLGQPKKLLIGGEWVEGTGDVFVSRNPADGSELASFRQANQADVDRAVAAANICFAEGRWHKQLSMRERARIMRQIGEVARQHQAELATLETLANGKTYQESYADDLPDCGDIFDYYSGWVDKHYGESVPVEQGFLNYTVKEPLGVCAQIVPWNFPLLMACWKIAPALATGNVVVIKPSEFTSFSLLRWLELVYEETDLPAGAINLVLGGGETGTALTGHADVHKVAFTGSTRTGKAIVAQSAASNLKHVSLELGGKSPNIFFADTPNLDAAIERSFQIMFAHKGEKCTEPTRFIVHQDIHDRVVEALVKKADGIVCGDPFDAKTQQGPQCHAAHFDSVMRYIDIGKEEGATLVCGGNAEKVAGFEKGLFIRPTIFTGVTPKMRIAQEEIFGPILAISSFRTDEEAIAQANDSIYGLAAGLWTSDVSRAHRVANAIDAGMIFINRYGCYDFTSPFGGFKQSGWGKEMAIHSLESYTKTKSIWLHHQG